MPTLRVGLLITAAILLVAVVGGGYLLYTIAKHDVWQDAVRGEGPQAAIEVEYTGFAISRTHVLYLSFDIRGHSQLNSAFWRVRPWRDVVMQK